MWILNRNLFLLAFLSSGLTEGTFPIWYSARNHVTHDHYAIQMSESITPLEVSKLLGLEHVGKLHNLDGYHLFAALKEDLLKQDRLELLFETTTSYSPLQKRGEYGLNHINHVHKEQLRKRAKRGSVLPQQSHAGSSISQQVNRIGLRDPGFRKQWHLVSPLNSIKIKSPLQLYYIFSAQLGEFR
ncbi:pheromone processing endoprotease [Basidiobolus ranarum]|uniref:Pheromone processing endoprotease n=1 Tax=Basidiobolus ranarum TaxID=34480 RepID=A0ABR2VMH6_9FUNG